MLVTGLLTLQTMFVGVGPIGVIIHVPTDAPTIQIAIDAAHPFDTIVVAPGTYFEAIGFHGKVITVQSTNPNDPSVVAATIINAGGLGSVVTFSGGEDQVYTILDGFTITGGTKGIDGHNSPAAIRNCVIRDNSNIGIFDCDGTIRRCEIRYNGAGGGGSRSGLQYCNGIIIDSRIERNVGSGVDGGSIDIIRCVIASNGSGVWGHTGDIEQSFIVGNRGNGVVSGTGLVRNSVIAGNAPRGFSQSQKNVVSCTVTGNQEYGLFYHEGIISHVILWNNVQGALFNSTTPVFSGTANPYFFQPGYWDFLNDVWVDGDYHLTQNSPYIDAGDPNYANDPSATTEDIEGNPRIVGAHVDIGAFEFQAAWEGDDFDGDGTPDGYDPDIDGDGVPNVTDVCDFTPQGVPVDDQGRPRADLNLDCKVDLRDFAVFQNSMSSP